MHTTLSVFTTLIFKTPSCSRKGLIFETRTIGAAAHAASAFAFALAFLATAIVTTGRWFHVELDGLERLKFGVLLQMRARTSDVTALHIAREIATVTDFDCIVQARAGLDV